MYERRSSPLHAARASAGIAFCAALAVAALLTSHPVVLVALLAATLLAGLGAGAGPALARTARYGVPIAALFVVINALVAHGGETVLVRGFDLPVLGRMDVTLESLAVGGVNGLRVLEVLLACTLYATCVDPDEVLRLLRGVGFRSALTATLATRLVPVLTLDARRVAEAQRCRPGPAPSRLTLVRAVVAGALERAVDVAATLEVRGYGAGGRPRRARRSASRHDVALFTSAALVVVAVAAARPAGLASFAALPRLQLAFGPGELALCVLVILAAGLPFLDRRGIAR